MCAGGSACVLMVVVPLIPLFIMCHSSGKRFLPGVTQLLFVCVGDPQCGGSDASTKGSHFLGVQKAPV